MIAICKCGPVKLGLPGYAVQPGDVFEVSDIATAKRFEGTGHLTILAIKDGDRLEIGGLTFRLAEDELPSGGFAVCPAPVDHNGTAVPFKRGPGRPPKPRDPAPEAA